MKGSDDMQRLKGRLQSYYLTALFSMVFAIAGFSYNAWRMEQSEANNTIRDACFYLFLTLSELEQVIYAAHYDQNTVLGSPRKGWVKVGLITDLLSLIPDQKQHNADKVAQVLLDTWSENWSKLPESRTATDKTIAVIESTKKFTKEVAKSLD